VVSSRFRISIHEVEGLTLRRAALLLRGCFAGGHAYVTLSGLRGARGLRVLSLPDDPAACILASPRHALFDAAPSRRRTAAPAGRSAAHTALERDPAEAPADAGQRIATRAAAGTAGDAAARHGRAAALAPPPRDRPGRRNAGLGRTPGPSLRQVSTISAGGVPSAAPAQGRRVCLSGRAAPAPRAHIGPGPLPGALARKPGKETSRGTKRDRKSGYNA